MVLKFKEPLWHSPMREPLPFNACFCFCFEPANPPQCWTCFGVVCLSSYHVFFPAEMFPADDCRNVRGSCCVQQKTYRLERSSWTVSRFKLVPPLLPTHSMRTALAYPSARCEPGQAKEMQDLCSVCDNRCSCWFHKKDIAMHKDEREPGDITPL